MERLEMSTMLVTGVSVLETEYERVALCSAIC